MFLPHSKSRPVPTHSQGLTLQGHCSDRWPISLFFFFWGGGSKKVDVNDAPQSQACGLQDNRNKWKQMLLSAATFSLKY
jgi:hypothetical protein